MTGSDSNLEGALKLLNHHYRKFEAMCEWCGDRATHYVGISDRKYYCKPHFNLATDKPDREPNRKERRAMKRN